MDQAAEALRSSKHPFLLIGPEFLGDPEAIEQLALLAEKTDSQVICLPVNGNLYGALLTGALAFNKPVINQPEVLYCIGDQPRSSAGFIIYQNAFPAEGFTADLGFPTAVFSERDGTLYNSETRPRSLAKAVEAPGLALPDWQIITRLAQKMGAGGFEFTSTGEIREEIASVCSNEFSGMDSGDISSILLAGSNFEPAYLDSPLSARVAGLRSLFPAKKLEAGGK